MRKIKKNYVVVAALTAAILMFTPSCKKESSNQSTSSKEPISLSDANKNISNQFGLSPWQIRSSEAAPQQGIVEMSEPDQTTCYGIIFDGFFGPTSGITVTHDGGATWHSQLIAALENNYLFGVAATTAKTVHVIGWNYATGGGNIFRSSDGGITWQREAANAYTDAASFPDAIKFFNPANGVIIGDPVNGSFEMYTTSDGGDNWNRVPSANIPAAQANEYGSVYQSDTYDNTIWTITQTVDNTGNVSNARLLQSDDRGIHWYVRNSSLPVTGGDGSLKFRNLSVGLFKNNGTLYRTADGGTTWNAVNYSGPWFSFDMDNVPGKAGWWISTGGGPEGTPNSVNGIGSSISYDDGDHWIALDNLNHTCVDMTSPVHGYSGGIATGSGNDGVFVYVLPPSGLPGFVPGGNAITNNSQGRIRQPSGNVSMPGGKLAAMQQFRSKR
jgi:hypothetical protein